MTDVPTSLALLPLVSVLAIGCGASDRDNAPASMTDSTVAAADTIYRNGPIITMDDRNPLAEAVAVLDGRITAVGSDADVAVLRAEDTVVVDLAGRTLSPGFIDGHVHVAQLGFQAIGANLLAPPDGQVENIDQLVRELQTFAAGDNLRRTGWVFGSGFDDAVLAEGRFPTRDDLDRVSTELPVIATHISGHFAVVNSKGLELIGYDADTPDPTGGLIRRYAESTEPNGVLEELAAIPHMMAVLTPRTADDRDFFMKRGIELAMSFGYTTAQEGRAFAASHEQLAAYAKETGFPIDVVSYIDYSDTSPLASAWYSSDYRNGYRVGGLKITLDGSPQGRTAWRTQPYILPPDGMPDDYSGYPAIPDDQIVMDIVDEAHIKGWQTLVHANGDAAVDQMLKAMTAAYERHGPKDRRNTLIHGQYIRPDQLQSMANIGMYASLFPMHTFYWGDWHEKIIGEPLGQQISPTRSALDLGLPLTSHTDAPVALPNLMQVVWATVNRRSRSGKIIGPDERLTPLEAMKSVTLWGARQHFEEDDKGSIEIGKLADLVILSANPLDTPPEQLNDIFVLETIKRGESVWKRAE